jgi:uncharacterized membrane protein
VSTVRKPRFDTPPVAANRLVTLTDGVFAIAMTILVLELGVPVADGVLADGELGEMLLEMWPDFLIYGLSFLVLGMFWLMHHAIFDAVVQYDFPLQWLNIVFLMFAALLPFSTALFGEHGTTQVTSLVYGLNMLAVALSAWGMWSYAAAGHRLVRADLDPALIRGSSRMGRAYAVVLLIPIGLSFASPLASFILYGAVVAGFLLATVSGRWDVAMVWPPTDRSQETDPLPGE